jgi:phage terminase Nu1 subunit (DNA packaging protein)
MKRKNSLTSDIKPIPTVMDRKQFAAFSGLSTGSVSAKVDAGVIVILRRNARRGSAMAIDVAASVKNLIAERAAKPDSARLTVANEQAERLRLSNAHRRGELMERSQVKSEVHAACASLVQALESTPQRCTVDDALQTKIREELHDARRAFAAKLEALAAD